MKKQMFILIFILSLSTGGAALTALNATYTDEFSQLVEQQKPLQAAETVYENFMGNMFWGVIIAILYVGFWMVTGSFYYPLIILDIMWFIFSLKVNPAFSIYVYVANVSAIGLLIMRAVGAAWRR